jgi:hypothetical protein
MRRAFARASQSSCPAAATWSDQTGRGAVSDRYDGWPENLITINDACRGLVLVEALSMWTLTELQAATIVEDHPELNSAQIRIVLDLCRESASLQFGDVKASVGNGVLVVTNNCPLDRWLTDKDRAWLRKQQIGL